MASRASAHTLKSANIILKELKCPGAPGGIGISLLEVEANGSVGRYDAEKIMKLKEHLEFNDEILEGIVELAKYLKWKP
jgi:hypothetical protein